MDVKSNPLTIIVDPIPTNAPSGFSGAIGRFAFNANVDTRNVKAGDPITLRVSVMGSGNIKLVTLPKPQLPADMESTSLRFQKKFRVMAVLFVERK